MTISIRANLTGNTSNTYGVTSIPVAVPSSIAAGDIIVVVIVQASAASPKYTTPSGFTQTLSPTTNSTTQYGTITVFTKVATGTESGTWTITNIGDAGGGWSIVAFSVAGASSTFGNSGANTAAGAYQGQGTAVPLNGPSVATGGTGNFVLWIGAGCNPEGESGSGNYVAGTTIPSGFTQTNATYAPTTGYTCEPIAVAGYTDPSSHTVSYNGSFTAGTGGTSLETYVFELILIPALPIKMYANGAFQSSNFIESSAAGPAMKMYSSNNVQVKTMVESSTGNPPSIGANTYTISNNSTTATTPPVTTQTRGSTFLAYMYTSSFVSMTDSFGNNYVSKGTFGPDGNGKYNIIYECVNGIGGANHTVTFTNSNAGNRTLFFVEILNSGGDDVAYYSTGNTTVSPVTYSLTTSTSSSNTNELALLFAGDYYAYAGYTANFTVGNSFNFLLTQNNSLTYQCGFIADFVTSNTSPISVTWSDSGVPTTSGSVTSVSTILTYNPTFPSIHKLYANGTFVSSQFIE